MKTSVAIQGIKGSYSEEAVHQIFNGDALILECTSFDETFTRVMGGAAKFAVVPVANTIVGEIEASMLLLKSSGLSVLKKLEVRVQHVLAGTQDAEFENLTTVRSHVEALKQCRKFLEANPQLKQIGSADTASSIRDVIATGDPSIAGIGSRRAVELYGAKILKENIADDIDNWTTFYLIGS